MFSDPLMIGGMVLLGILVGFISGMLGIGGGVLVVPILVIVFGFKQQEANGTSLTMLFPPAAIPAIHTYWKAGNVRLDAAILLAIGFILGAWLGAHTANMISPDRLRQFFAFFLLFIAAMMLFRGDLSARAVTTTIALVLIYALAYALMRLLGRRWQHLPVAASIYRERLKQPFAPDYEI
jgi:uncharacterized protein